MEDIIVRVATEEDEQFAKIITDEMEASAKVRGTGIAKRSPAAIIEKIREGKAVIAVTTGNTWVGFSYIEIWSNGEFVSNSGLIVNPAFRERGVASAIKQRIFKLSRKKYPAAKIFSITTGLAIMRMNSRLGFEPVTYNEITYEERFWSACKSCPNYHILESKSFKNCMCTAMLYMPKGSTDKYNFFEKHDTAVVR
ncbi:N-acetyltransferase [Chitinophaga oryziterrae]|uniref:N-acetyltransferase n=1 Tax=Chitinophaga oryziterrae TaxID=1031224 RepID=A0A6N8JFJ5_9BACT|nr:N-acetyltransferase [Chitinophaga oryziterrae]MVT43099.1 N-acetyltransferase [Chitinophaga oryziterrae]